jgi:hypothetical protein
VIANAGVQPKAMGAIMSFEQMTRYTHSVNTNGILNTVFPLSNKFRQLKNGKQFIIISSASSFIPLIGTAYPSTKAWATQFGRNYRHEMCYDNVSVVTITPGFVGTQFVSNIDASLLFWQMSPEECARKIFNASRTDESLCLMPKYRYMALINVLAVLGYKFVDYIGAITKVREPCNDFELPPLDIKGDENDGVLTQKQVGGLGDFIVPPDLPNNQSTSKEKLTIPNSDSIKSNNASFNHTLTTKSNKND